MGRAERGADEMGERRESYFFTCQDAYVKHEKSLPVPAEIAPGKLSAYVMFQGQR
jgi:hypothetical protein